MFFVAFHLNMGLRSAIYSQVHLEDEHGSDVFHNQSIWSWI